jgi:hypothetical protein
MCVCVCVLILSIGEREGGERGGEMANTLVSQKRREKRSRRFFPPLALSLFEIALARAFFPFRSTTTMTSASPSSLAAATQAFVDEDYATAEGHYSTALAARPGGDAEAEALCGRSATRMKLDDFLGAADDARRAVALSPGLAKAHVRRG